jgi:hypothetical protein
MNLQSIWSVAATVYGLTAVGLAGLAWVVGRQGQRGRETNALAGAVMALTLYYGCFAVDAFLRAGGWTQERFTLWGGAGQTLGLLFWALVCQFLAFLVARLLAPERVDWWIIPFLPICVFALSGISLVLLGWAVWDFWRAAPSATIQSDLVRLCKSWVRFGGGGVVITVVGAPVNLLTPVWRRLPKEQRTGLFRVRASQDAFENLTSLNIEQYRGKWPDYGRAVSKSEVGGLPVIYLTGLLVWGIPLFNMFDRWTPAVGIATLVLRVLLLAGVMGLIYNHARFAFFDVALKRGVCFAALAAIAAPFAYFGLSHFIQGGAAPEAAFVIGATLFGCACVWVYHHCDHMLDRLIFRRPDYRQVLREICDAMARCGDVESLTQVVTKRLPGILHAEFAHFAPEPQPHASAMVPIGNPERLRGYLLFGPRERGQQYQSEDLNFLDAVASQFSAMLESFDARQLRHLTMGAELKALRAQINPHFLFNALNTLADMAKDNVEMEKTVLHLARIFRYAVDSTRREVVPLREEIDFIRSYLEIERARFEEKLRFEIDAPESLLDTPVPPMLIQPLVENAVKHGISPKIEGGTIHVSVRAIPHGLSIRVDDDGVGFNPAEVKVNVGWNRNGSAKR